MSSPHLPTKQRFVVKRTSTGLGLFVVQHIAAKQRIIEYVGAIITNEEANRKGGKYLFAVDNKRTIDGSARSNLARYINHSCRPNAESVAARGRVWIWSKKAIHTGEEITINYGKTYFDTYIKPHGCRCRKCVAV